jgi:hypothetical protein
LPADAAHTDVAIVIGGARARLFISNTEHPGLSADGGWHVAVRLPVVSEWLAGSAAVEGQPIVTLMI